MLQLLRHPCWTSATAPAQALPVTVPAALLIVLASRDGWADREGLATLLWPDARRADAMHHLRINLHRARSLVNGWGRREALVAERTRVRLDLPCDLRPFEQALATRDAAALAATQPARWLEGWRLPGFGHFADWCDGEARRLLAAWRTACPPALALALRGGQFDAAQALFGAWRASGEPAARALAPADLAALDDETQARWWQWLEAAEGDAAGGRRPAPARPVAGRLAEQAGLLASRAAALVLLGEPGIGKSTLVDATWPGTPRLQGREGLQAVPYRPLLEALRAEGPALRRALADPDHALAAYRLDLARVLPELAPTEPLPPLDAVTAKSRLTDGLALAAETIAPVWRVDDLQWCDAATLEWLVFVAHRGRLRWRATARRHELGEPARRALDALRAPALLEEQVLAALSPQALAQLCQARWPGQHFGDDRLARLHAASQGNAFVVGELVAAGLDSVAGDPPPERVLDLVQRRLAQLVPADRLLVEAAAVMAEPVPAAALRCLVDPTQAPADSDSATAAAAWADRCDRLVEAGLLRFEGARLGCSHDLVRHAACNAIGPARLAHLHRQAALWLAGQADADSLVIAGHWQAAHEPQTALAWLHRGALLHKAMGRFDDARALWQQVAGQSSDVALALRAQLEVAACTFFDDLAASQTALEAVRAQLGAVADPVQHDLLQARVLTSLVDNRVFAGDLAAARASAGPLRQLLPRLPTPEHMDGIEVLIELAMREPDIPAAWQHLGELRRLAPQRPAVLSFEGQIHWFSGNVRAACDALRQLLERHPAHRHGLTIENDLAVMLHALGELTEAETMARRSLRSWQGVAHTETLSLLVLGVVLTSQGRHAEADASFVRALALAGEQSSPGFEAEAQVRRARLALQCGRLADARDALAAAAPRLRDSPEPLRVSQWALAEVLLAGALGQPVDPGVLARLADVASRSTHPLVQARVARVAVDLALAAADPQRAAAAADEQAAVARRAGLREPLAEALLLRARAGRLAGEPVDALLPSALEAAALAVAHGFADLQWRAHAWLAAEAGIRGAAVRAREALRQLRGEVRPSLFDEATAARREPRPTAAAAPAPTPGGCASPG